MRVRAPRSEPDVRSSAGQVPRLAHLLRTVRLSLLYGPAGFGKTTLLRGGLLPTLGRRKADVPPAPRPAQVVVPFVERRGGSAGLLADEGIELPVFFDAWGIEPLAALRQAIEGAAAKIEPGQLALAPAGLAVPLEGGRFQSVRFLIVLDGFEQHLAQPSHRADIQAFDVALVDALNRPFLPMHFLIAVRAEAESELTRYRSRIPRFDDHFLRLEASNVMPASSLLWRGSGPVAVPPAVPRATENVVPAPAPALADESVAWLASLDALVFKVAEAGREDGRISRRPEVPELRDELPQAPARPAPLPPPAAPAADRVGAPTHAAARRSGPTSSVAWAVVAGLVGVGLWWVWLQAPTPPSPAPPSAAGHVDQPLAPPVAAPAPPAVARVPFDLALDPQSGDARIAQDLARVVAPAAGLVLNPLPGDLASSAASLAPAALRIARYDALQARRGRADAAALRVIAPLVIQPVGFIVRDDSPLRFIHQLKGRRIDIGPPGSGRALTAASIYERLFGARPAPNAGLGADTPTALQRLRDGGSGFDAVVSLGEAPPPGNGLRLLKLDRDQAASRRVLQSYLPATLDDTPTLGVMSFLVAAAPPDAASRRRLADLAASLCQALPLLQREADPRWRQLRQGIDLDTGLPALPEAQAAWRNCSRSP